MRIEPKNSRSRRRHKSAREMAAEAAAMPPLHQQFPEATVSRDERWHTLYALLTNKRKAFSTGVAKLRELIKEGVKGADGADPEELCQLEDAHGTTASRISLLDETVTRIDRARQALEDGTYGICVGCEEQIPLGRLKALPFADRCLPCQKLKESEAEEHQHWTGRRDPFVGKTVS